MRKNSNRKERMLYIVKTSHRDMVIVMISVMALFGRVLWFNIFNFHIFSGFISVTLYTFFICISAILSHVLMLYWFL